MAGYSGTLLIARPRVAALADSKEYLACMRDAFADLAAQRYELPAVSHVRGNGGGFHVKAAVRAGNRGIAAVKVNANFPGNAERSLPTIQGFIALFDANDGTLLALMDSIEITARRTAAVTALAATLLARPESRVLAIVGCGMQARYHLEALRDVMPIEEVRFYDRDQVAAHAFAQRVEALRLLPVRAASVRETVRPADVIVTLTASVQPLLDIDDVGSGTLVAGVGADAPTKHELAPGLLAGSRVVVDLLSQASVMGDLHHAIDTGAMIAADIHGELAEVVAGRVPARTDSRERFVFDSTGMALEDLAAARMVYDRACAAGGCDFIELNAPAASRAAVR